MWNPWKRAQLIKSKDVLDFSSEIHPRLHGIPSCFERHGAPQHQHWIPFPILFCQTLLAVVKIATDLRTSLWRCSEASRMAEWLLGRAGWREQVRAGLEWM